MMTRSEKASSPEQGSLFNPFLNDMIDLRHPMTRWRGRIRREDAEETLAESIRAGLRTNLIRRPNLERVNVDTTVQ